MFWHARAFKFPILLPEVQWKKFIRKKIGLWKFHKQVLLGKWTMLVINQLWLYLWIWYFLIVLLKHQVIKKIIGEMVFCGCHFCKRGKYKKYNALKADKLYLSNKLWTLKIQKHHKKFFFNTEPDVLRFFITYTFLSHKKVWKVCYQRSLPRLF